MPIPAEWRSHRTGGSLYVANSGTDNVAVFTIDGTTGALTSNGTGTLPANANPSGVAISPNGQFLYVANSGTDNVSVFPIDGNNGTLGVISTTSAIPGTAPKGISIEPNGQFLYVANGGNDSVLNVHH